MAASGVGLDPFVFLPLVRHRGAEDPMEAVGARHGRVSGNAAQAGGALIALQHRAFPLAVEGEGAEVLRGDDVQQVDPVGIAPFEGLAVLVEIDNGDECGLCLLQYPSIQKAGFLWISHGLGRRRVF
jgi:hypothetical protein